MIIKLPVWLAIFYESLQLEIMYLIFVRMRWFPLITLLSNMVQLYSLCTISMYMSVPRKQENSQSEDTELEDIENDLW